MIIILVKIDWHSAVEKEELPLHNGCTPLRAITTELISRIGKADLLIGIPSFNNGKTIGYVVRQVAAGLKEHFPGVPAAVLIADGGSTMDDSREVALAALKETGTHGVVGIYRGLPGKGSAVRMIFAAAEQLGTGAVALMDADLRSITPLWVERLLAPVIRGGYDFVAPLYNRYKYDGTITNNVTYNMIRCLYGKQIRQPIGGEFAFSGKLASDLAGEKVWESDVARFGIDIWLTVKAITRKARLCQTHLGVKVHDPKDPAASLEPMFRQVVGTLFRLMEETESAWKCASESQTVDTWGESGKEEPEPFPINRDRLLEHLFLSIHTLKGAWASILTKETFSELEIHLSMGKQVFLLPTSLWAKILFEFAAAYHHRNVAKTQVIEVLSPLYFARVAAFIKRVEAYSNEDAEKVVEEQARIFELHKPYLARVWDDSSIGCE